jgi:hypothetical protein
MDTLLPKVLGLAGDILAASASGLKERVKKLRGFDGGRDARDAH